MNDKLKVLIAALVLAAVFSNREYCAHAGFGQATTHTGPPGAKGGLEQLLERAPGTDTSASNLLYRWDEQQYQWVPVKDPQVARAQFLAYNQPGNLGTEPIKVTWRELTDIQYRLRYFRELDMEIYAPEFSEAVKALDGKEIVIEGYVIPFEFEGKEEVLSLSANPYASCFFCGRASPASVMSLYLKARRRYYKMDAFKKFSGTLHLNYDDPNEFYYILRDAKEE